MVESETNDSMANGLRTDTSNGSATRVDDGTGLCADISARDEFVPWDQRKSGEARALLENLGNVLATLIQDVADLKRDQQNLRAAGKTVDDIYVRVIEIERVQERLDEIDISEIGNRLDELESKADDIDPDDFVKEGDLDDKIRDEVMYCLTHRVNMTVNVEEN